MFIVDVICQIITDIALVQAVAMADDFISLMASAAEDKQSHGKI